MAVPDFQTLMLPLLKMASDGKEHSLSGAREAIASQFQLSLSDQEESLPSGRQTRFANRVAWAKVYLHQAGLLFSPRRGHFQISEKGRDVLKSHPLRITIKFLEQFPEFLEFRNPKNGGEEQSSEAVATPAEPETPEEALEAAHLKMKTSLSTEVLAKVKDSSSEFFGNWW